ncbi:dihydroneopterin triphosphate diphosphatase [Alteromonas sediminis]|uniref:Dihydroneopterin triphosphate diphosphatase n=1 Tax=Alteromonas sediminis TaxID=2259342 RepID=A0A3N5Y4N5_9ALTE|nr:dihydroneopterin triphosphate diphosphatase [Alteromonas sediminis]RPJ68550.1 dihydroneopterin triphosphate diphosphatase [Alteromonas sediminis]
MAYKRPESVLVVVYSDQHQVLLLQRKDDPEFWQSVTGTLEDGETPAMTAFREVKEELGIDLSDDPMAIIDCHTVNQFAIRPRWRYRYPPNTYSNTEYVFCTQISQSATIILTEHLALEWLSKQQAIERAWSPSNRRAIEAFVPEPKS